MRAPRSHRPRPFGRVGLLVGVLVLLGAAGLSSPAWAHGDEGELTVIAAEPVGDLQVQVEVGLLYANDEDLVTGAVVAVSGTGPGGAVLDATTLENTDGAKYTGTVTVPVAGSWMLTFASESPEAEATTTVEVPAVEAGTTTTVATSSTSAAGSTSSPSDASTTAVAATEPSAAEPSGAGASEAEGQGTSPAVLIAAGLAAVAVVAGAVLLARRRSSSGDASGSGEAGGPTDPGTGT